MVVNEGGLTHTAIMPPGTQYYLDQRWDAIMDGVEFLGTNLGAYNGDTRINTQRSGVNPVGPGAFRNDPVLTGNLVSNADRDGDNKTCGNPGIEETELEKFESCIVLGKYVIDTTAKAIAVLTGSSANTFAAYNNGASFLLTAELDVEMGVNNCNPVGIWNMDRLLDEASWAGVDSKVNPPGPLKTQVTNAKKDLENFVNNGCADLPNGFNLGIKRDNKITFESPEMNIYQGGERVLTETLNSARLVDIRTVVTNDAQKFVVFRYGPFNGGETLTPFFTSSNASPTIWKMLETGVGKDETSPKVCPTVNGFNTTPKSQIPAGASTTTSCKVAIVEHTLGSILAGKTINKIYYTGVTPTYSGTTSGCNVKSENYATFTKPSAFAASTAWDNAYSTNSKTYLTTCPTGSTWTLYDDSTGSSTNDAKSEMDAHLTANKLWYSTAWTLPNNRDLVGLITFSGTLTLNVDYK